MKIKLLRASKTVKEVQWRGQLRRRSKAVAAQYGFVDGG
jgi:hypothetical protein